MRANLWPLVMWVMSANASASEGPTYYKDVAPIIDGRCVACHQQGGIAPFSLESPDDVKRRAHQLAEAVGQLHMPPWPADRACAEYEHDRSLSVEQIKTITRWASTGAPLGNESERGEPLAPVGGGLSRVDVKLAMEAPYTPQASPDDYRCFVFDWPADAKPFITGFAVLPGNKSIVHHAAVHIVPPEGVAQLDALDAADPGEGYRCLDLPDVVSSSWLSFWAPGTPDMNFPEGTGIAVKPGSKFMLRVHYHWHPHEFHHPGDHTDQSALAFKTDTQVRKEAKLIAWFDPNWLEPGSMPIPAGNGDVRHAFSADLGAAVGRDKPVKIWGAFHHMHQLGRSGRISIEHADRSECLVDIPRWDFDWQLQYWFKQPKIIKPGERMRIECRWDNSRGNQPVTDGIREVPRDVTWGQGTRDEMCFGLFYATVGDD